MFYVLVACNYFTNEFDVAAYGFDGCFDDVIERVSGAWKSLGFPVLERRVYDRDVYDRYFDDDKGYVDVDSLIIHCDDYFI